VTKTYNALWAWFFSSLLAEHHLLRRTDMPPYAVGSLWWCWIPDPRCWILKHRFRCSDTKLVTSCVMLGYKNDRRQMFFKKLFSYCLIPFLSLVWLNLFQQHKNYCVNYLRTYTYHLFRWNRTILRGNINHLITNYSKRNVLS
jgi:hypothetical protein